jgi:hypothetical protein
VIPQHVSGRLLSGGAADVYLSDAYCCRRWGTPVAWTVGKCRPAGQSLMSAQQRDKAEQVRQDDDRFAGLPHAPIVRVRALRLP